MEFDLKPVTRIFLQKHEPISFEFSSAPETFFVDEVASIRFSGKGNTLILHIKKTYLSTWELVDILCEQLDIPKHQIGYAGLKDKHATTTQYISIPKSYEKFLAKFSHPQITILKTFTHNSALNIGDLKGNHFTITLNKVTPIFAGKMEKAFKKIVKEGMANYFGYQRFGRDEHSIEEGYAVVHHDKPITDKRLEKFIVSAYSSHLFNAWLAHRIQEGFEFLEGELFMNLSTEKLFTPKNLLQAKTDFEKHLITPTGLISGGRVPRAEAKAGEIETLYDDIEIDQKGLRRAAFVFVSDEKFAYDITNKSVTLSFTLPKSSYATVLLENLALQAI